MKYKSEYDIIMNDGIYRSKNGIVEMDHELPESFERVKEEIKTDWKKLAIDAGLEGDNLKKFMKMNATNKQKKLDSLEAK